MKTDVLVIGGGPAGIFCAREAAKHCNVTVVTCGNVFRPELSEIVLPSEKYGSADEFYEETVKTGLNFNYMELTKHFCSRGFDLTKKDLLSGSTDFSVLKNVRAIRLDYKKGRITGAYCFDTKDKKGFFISASSVVLATGGFGRVFDTSEDIMSCDAIAMAYDVGAAIIDIEFILFEGFDTPRTPGGVLINKNAETAGVNGLFACGEVTGGLHGACIIPDNLLTEAVVFGKIAGESAAEYAKKSGNIPNTIYETEDHPAPFDVKKACEDIKRAAISGLSCPRCVDRLHPALKTTKEIADMAQKYPDSFDAVRIYNGATTVYITLWAAYSRYHSIGPHIRSDNKMPALKSNIHNRYMIKHNGDIMTGRITSRNYNWDQILNAIFLRHL